VRALAAQAIPPVTLELFTGAQCSPYLIGSPAPAFAAMRRALHAPQDTPCDVYPITASTEGAKTSLPILFYFSRFDRIYVGGLDEGPKFLTGLGAPKTPLDHHGRVHGWPMLTRDGALTVLPEGSARGTTCECAAARGNASL
jgi:hypothetical protein